MILKGNAEKWFRQGSIYGALTHMALIASTEGNRDKVKDIEEELKERGFYDIYLKNNKYGNDEILEKVAKGS